MTDPIEITFKPASDVYNFKMGDPLIWTDGRGFRPPTWRDALHDRWRHMTRWWRPRFVVARLDVEAGSITMVEERWSWLRWGWVQQ